MRKSSSQTRKLATLLLMFFCTTAMVAQNYLLTGKVADQQTNEAIEMAGVRVMKLDSTFVTGKSTDEKGEFSLDVKKAGAYIVKFSFIGYNPVYRHVTLTKQSPSMQMGTIKLTTNDRMLKTASVTAHVAKLEMHRDTFVYNAAAYRVPEGSMLETLVEMLPGAVVDDNGGVTINGKTVSEILVDGKDFFKGDTKVAMKNVPVSVINRIKSYDKQSDYTRETGIDDGNEKTVLDLELKQKLKNTWFSNIDLGYGNYDRYSTNMFVTTFNDHSRISMFGSADNTGGQRFRGRGGWGGSSGLNASKNIGGDGYWNNGKKESEAGFFEGGGSVFFNYSNSDNLNRSNSEQFLVAGQDGTQTSSFSNRASHSLNHNMNVSVNGNLRWRPDTVINFYLRPSFNHNHSNGWSESRSATFNDDPYSVTESPLDDAFATTDKTKIRPDLLVMAINRNLNESKSYNRSNNASANGGMNIKFKKKGRNMGIDAGINTSKSKSTNRSLSLIDYYKNDLRSNNDQYQYSASPSKNWGYNTRLSYNEPLWTDWFLQASYNYSYSYSDRDRKLDIDTLASWRNIDLLNINELEQRELLKLEEDTRNSQYATYNNYRHAINVGLRYVVKDKINLSFGANVEPQHQRLDYVKNLLDTTVTRNVFNIAPNLRMRYNLGERSRLEFRYRGSSSQPSMTDLLDVIDNSDPLNISSGNPNLKPSWSNNLNGYYYNYWQPHQTSLSASVNFSQTSNSITNRMQYDTQTGVRHTKPENINGNWNAGGDITFNTGIGSENMFNINNDVSTYFNHRVGYISLQNTESARNTVKTWNLSDRIQASYRNSFVEFGLTGDISYSRSRSKLNPRNDMDTYNFSYGGRFQWTTPWGMNLSTNLSMNSRRGYNDASMNTNELIWNAQISQSFLTEKAATISIQFFDLLHQQSSISRSVTAFSRSDSWSNAIHSYFMVHFNYRLNILNGANGRIRGGSGQRGGNGGGQRGGGGGAPARIGGANPGGGPR